MRPPRITEIILNDEKVAYPFWEKTAKLGIKNLCVHKGLPLSVFNEKACTPLDLEKAAPGLAAPGYARSTSEIPNPAILNTAGFGWKTAASRRRR